MFSIHWKFRFSNALAAAGFILAALPSSTTAGQSGAARPNFVVILTDDQTMDQMAYLPLTLGVLGGSGVVFDRAYATTPNCCPSRSSTLTGLYARNHGVIRNGGGAERFRELGLEQRTIANVLHDSGYATAFIGKYLNGYRRIANCVPAGWDYWLAFTIVDGVRGLGYFNYQVSLNGSLVNYGDAESDYSTDVFANKALAVLRKLGRVDPDCSTPFLLFFAPFGPHNPGTPAPRHAGLHPGLAAPRTPNYAESDVSAKPSWVRNLVWTSEAEEKHDELYSSGARSLAAVDEAVAAIVSEVRRMGRLDDTVFLFMSDNGYSHGSHRWGTKQAEYEECVRVPLLISYPRLIASPRVESRLVANIDLAPTIAELAGVSLPGPIDGLSLVPLLQGPGAPWDREAICIEGWEDELRDNPECGPDSTCSTPTFRGVVTDRWKYVEVGDGEVELYKLSVDRFELENRASAGIAARFAGDLQRLFDVAFREGPSRSSSRSVIEGRDGSARMFE